MKKILFLFLILYAAPSYAALSAAQFATAMHNSDRFQNALRADSNIVLSLRSPTNYQQSGWFNSAQNGSKIELLTPLGWLPTPAITAPVAAIVGDIAAPILATKVLGVLGPVGEIVQVGMFLNDLYNAAQANPGAYPLTSSLGSAAVSPTLNKDTPVGTVISIPSGGAHTITINRGITNSPTAKSLYDSGGCIYGSNWVQLGINLSTDGNTYNSYIIFSFNNLGTLPVSPATESVWQNLYTDTLNPTPPYLKQAYLDEASAIEKVAQAANNGNVVVNPTADQIDALTRDPSITAANVSTTQANNVAAAQAAANTAATNAAAHPTDLALTQALANANANLTVALAAQAAAANQASQEPPLLVPPDLPPNVYDPSITPPDKKDIASLLLSFFSGSPLVSMVKSFVMNTTDTACSMPVGIVYGQQLTFDFCRYQSTLTACGGVLLIIMHGFAIFIVVRGW